jgi:hypothetical protein
MYCQTCAAQLVADARFCENCGAALGAPQPYAPPVYRQPVKPTNNLALLGLILAFVMPVAGLIVSIVARRQCIERGEDGEKMAKIGIIVGVIYSALIFVIFVAALVISFVMLSPAFDAPVAPNLQIVF